MVEQWIRRTPDAKSQRCGVAGPERMPASDGLSGRAHASRCRLTLPRLTWLPPLVFVLLLGVLFPSPKPSYADKKTKPENTHIVDINHASVEELTTLPGIGKVTARKIVEFREKNGPFRRLEDLLIIRGISEKRLQQILPRISLGPDPKEPEKKTK
jgi:competence protein ComEA